MKQKKPTKKELEAALLADIESIFKTRKTPAKAKKKAKPKSKPKAKPKPKTKPKPRKKPEPKPKQKQLTVPQAKPTEFLQGGYLAGQSVKKAFFDAIEKGWNPYVKYQGEIIPFDIDKAFEFESIYEDIESYYLDKALELDLDSPNLQIGYAESLEKNAIIFDFDSVLFATEDFTEELKEEEPEQYRKINTNLKRKIKRTFDSYGITNSKKSKVRSKPKK